MNHTHHISRVCQSSVSVWSRRLCATCASAIASLFSWSRSFLISTSVAIVRNIRLSFGIWLRVDFFPFMYMVVSRRKFSSAVVLVFLFTILHLSGCFLALTVIYAHSLCTRRDFISLKFLGEIKTRLVFWLLVNERFRTRICSTRQRKLILPIPFYGN